jgi:hypothetical protein
MEPHIAVMETQHTVVMVQAPVPMGTQPMAQTVGVAQDMGIRLTATKVVH